LLAEAGSGLIYNRGMNKRALVITALSAALIGGAYFTWQKYGNGGDAPQFKLAKVENGPLVAVVSATGTLTPVVSVQVSSQVSGQIREIFVDFNSTVKQGQLIARIAPETFEHKVHQAEADLEASSAAVGVQLAEALRARANLAEAQRDYERKKMLVDKNYISPAERDKARSLFDAAAAALQVVESQAKNASAVVRQREAQLGQARVDLERTQIRAPVDGIVVKRSVEPGQTVAASLQAPEMFVIAKSLSDMQVEASIDEADIGRVKAGQSATFTVDAFPGRSFSGEVKQVRKAATVVSNVVSYTVVVSASNPDLTLLPGMTANVRITTAQRDKVLKVANAALRFRPPGTSDEKKPASAAAVSPAPTSGAGGGGGGGPGQMRERLIAELKLNADQQEKLAAVFTGMRDKFMAARELPEAERAKASERNRAEIREKVAAFLTDEQKTRYTQMNAEAAAARSGAGGGEGRVWTLDSNGKPQAVTIKLGLTDGSMTQIVSGEIKEGSEVITGQQQATKTATTTGGGPGPRLF
jgi:HlyD family secretion protein